MFTILNIRFGERMACKQRVIMRIVVGAEVPAMMSAAVERWGSSTVIVNSRLIEWLCRQPSDIQAAVLGLYPGKIDLPARIIERLKDG